jgi:hypothetical protein
MTDSYFIDYNECSGGGGAPSSSTPLDLIGFGGTGYINNNHYHSNCVFVHPPEDPPVIHYFGPPDDYKTAVKELVADPTNLEKISKYFEASKRLSDMQGELSITKIVDKFAEMNKHHYVDSYSGQHYHLSDIIDVSSLPKKTLFQKIGSLRHDGASGSVFFGDEEVSWDIPDRNFLENYKKIT